MKIYDREFEKLNNDLFYVSYYSRSELYLRKYALGHARDEEESEKNALFDCVAVKVNLN